MIVRAPAVPDLPEVLEWRVHLGAHKTATTHLQNTLQAIRPALSDRDVDVPPLPPLRAAWRRHVNFYLKTRRPLRKMQVRWSCHPMAPALLAALAPLLEGPRVVVLSEENLLGDTRDAVGGLYPDLSGRMRLLGALRSVAQLHLFLAIRRMDEFLASSYAEALRHFAFPARFEEVTRAVLATPPSWRDVVGTIQTTLPGVPLTLWRYEDYHAHAGQIVTALCGADPGPLPVLERPPTTMTPSTEAVRAAEALRLPPGPDRNAEVARLYDAMPASPERPAFRPYDSATIARFAQAYADDIAALADQGLLRDFDAAPG